ncbi:MAG: Hsp70 family protein [Planctomycetes bacterium]|nr:Hsp70 family protein [Planctomycetota bacterium]
MRKQGAPAVGIDLGTTYSVAAALDASGRPRTLTNAEGDILTPSVVRFDGYDVAVGRPALDAMLTDMPNVAECPKRELGQRVFPKMIGGRQYPPEALEAWVLNKIRLDAARHVGDIEKVVITVPAYFDEVRRKATMDAGYMAGFDVMDIINEPTAAAVAFGFHEGFLRGDGAAHGSTSPSSSQNVLVYDLGGGTFDVTVMEIRGHDFLTLATDGDMRLGGRDWDQRLVDYVAEEFIRTYGVDPREDPHAFGRLLRACELAKRRLSSEPSATIVFEYEGCPNRTEVTRALFEELTVDLLERTLLTTRQTLEAAGIAWRDVDRILMVGGSTHMPAVPRMLEHLSGRAPDRSVSPEEAVAQGAALHAGLLLSLHAGAAPPFSIRNVNSHSLGVVAQDAKTHEERNAILIPRNTPIPADARRVFRTRHANQASIRIEIIEGESSSPADCSFVGKCSVRPLPPNLPAKTPIEVRFHYEENGRLNVRVGLPGEPTLLHHELTRENSLSQEHLDRWRHYISQVPPPGHETA